MNLPEFLAFVTVYFCMPLAWATVGLSFMLRENRVPSLSVAVAVTAFAAVFLNNDMAVPILTPDQTRVIARIPFVCMVLAVCFDWMRDYRERLTVYWRNKK